MIQEKFCKRAFCEKCSLNCRASIFIHEIVIFIADKNPPNFTEKIRRFHINYVGITFYPSANFSYKRCYYPLFVLCGRGEPVWKGLRSLPAGLGFIDAALVSEGSGSTIARAQAAKAPKEKIPCGSATAGDLSCVPILRRGIRCYFCQFQL